MTPLFSSTGNDFARQRKVYGIAAGGYWQNGFPFGVGQVAYPQLATSVGVPVFGEAIAVRNIRSCYGRTPIPTKRGRPGKPHNRVSVCVRAGVLRLRPIGAAAEVVWS
jgi:hypothetical protein